MIETSNKKHILRAAAMLLCAVLILCSLACSGKGGEPRQTDAADDGRFGLSDAQYDELMRLSAAFRVFGKYDVAEGNEFSKLEFIVFCYFSEFIEETSPAGFGTVTAEAADEAINRIFGKLEIMDVMRRKYNENEDQTYYFKNGEYKVRITDNSAYTYAVKSLEKTETDGNTVYSATVRVSREGEPQLDLLFTLTPQGEGFRVDSCGVNLWY